MFLSNVVPPDEGVQHKQDNTNAVVESRDLGSGTLFVSESILTWIGPGGQGFSLDYPSISLHAVSRDLNAYPQECLYLMVDGKVLEEDEADKQSNSSEEETSQDDSPVTEVRFIPADKGALEAMFSAMSACQTLHPDPDDTDSEAEEEQEEDGYYEGEEGVEHLTPEGQATLARLENMLLAGQGDAPPSTQNGHASMENPGAEDEMDTGQFDDADAANKK